MDLRAGMHLFLLSQKEKDYLPAEKLILLTKVSGLTDRDG